MKQLMIRTQEPLLQMALIVTLSVLSTGCGNFFGIKGEGPLMENTRAVLAFDGIELNIAADVFIVPGEAGTLRIEGQQNILDVLETNVTDNKLVIRFSKNVRTSEGISIYASLPTLRTLDISGSGTCTSRQTIESVSIEVEISGSGSANLDIVTNKLNAAISGSGMLNVKGSAVETNYDISGSGSVEASNVNTKNCRTEISGSGRATVYVIDKLDADISGSGTIMYTGSPVVTSTVSGSGKVVNAN